MRKKKVCVVNTVGDLFMLAFFPEGCNEMQHGLKRSCAYIQGGGGLLRETTERHPSEPGPTHRLVLLMQARNLAHEISDFSV